jgi:hypothetical protein
MSRDKQKLKLGDRVVVHYDNSVGTIIEVKRSGVGWLYTVKGDKPPPLYHRQPICQ